MNLASCIRAAGKAAYKSLSKNSPEILVALGIAGFFTAGVMAVKATPDAMQDIEEKKEELEVEELETVEVVKTVYKRYIPAVTVAMLSASSIIFSNRMYAKANAALMTALSISENAFKDYKEQTLKEVGPRKEKKIVEEALSENIKRDPPPSSVVQLVGQGENLFYEPISKQYFICRTSEIDKIINNCNAMMVADNFVSVNDYLEEIMRYDRTGRLRFMEGGSDIGWHGYSKEDFLVKSSWGHTWDDDDNHAAVLYLDRPPSYDYKY